MAFMKGIIALDIDGTITAEPNSIPIDVVDYFQELANEGWLFIFITGRTFQLANQVLNFFNFPFYMAVQNGAIILEMPSKTVIAKNYLKKDILPIMENLCQHEPTGFVVYSGFENNDLCYYRSSDFSKEILSLLKQRCIALKEEWIDLPSFDDLPIADFASVKSFGLYESALAITNQIEQLLGLHVPLMKDPFLKNYYVVQATESSVTKGSALRKFINLQSVSLKVIAGGDDNNDKSMLETADIQIVMANAPQDMLLKADVIAPPASEKGIIKGLVEAIQLFHSKNIHSV
jgi:HAD superfamily hydrolase (TIGR01484 family)